MAADIQQLIKNFCAFFDFTGKTLISVGVGGGQLVEYGRQAIRILAVDQDAAALRQLEVRIADLDFRSKFELCLSDFMQVQEKADVVVFEFSHHEMPDPAAAIAHARTLASDVLVIDHAPGSEWAYYVCEELLVANSYQAMDLAGIRRQRIYATEQRFNHFEELHNKVAVQGALAIDRIEKFIGATQFAIPMRYGITLL
jgi:hypothetical protein